MQHTNQPVVPDAHRPIRLLWSNSSYKATDILQKNRKWSRTHSSMSLWSWVRDRVFRVDRNSHPTSIDSTNQKSIDNHLEESIDSSPDDVIEDFPEGPIDSWENDYYNPIFAVDTATPSDRANLHTEEYDDDYEDERATEYRGIRVEEDRLLHHSYGITNRRRSMKPSQHRSTLIITRHNVHEHRPTFPTTHRSKTESTIHKKETIQLAVGQMSIITRAMQ